MLYLQRFDSIKGSKISANDGEIGKVTDVYFEEDTWTIRYLVARPGGWFTAKEVLLSPIAVDDFPQGEDSTIRVYLTRDQIKNSPEFNSAKPVSREYEVEYYRYYGWPTYWGFGAGIWGSGIRPEDLRNVKELIEGEKANQSPEDKTNLRSSKEIKGYNIQAEDGDIGHVEDFVFDTTSWVIRYFIVDTRNWLPGGKKVMLSPEWVDQISWLEKNVKMRLTKKAIESSPEFSEEKSLEREFEERLFSHFDKPGYWDQGTHL